MMRSISAIFAIASLSVCPSVTLVHCAKTAVHTIKLFPTSDSPIDGVTVVGGVKAGWLRKFRDFQPLSCYILETIRDSPIIAVKR